MILLIERPFQPGDWIEVGGFSGNAKRINVRSTEILTFDRSSVFVPISELIAASVVNWAHRSLVGRAIVKIGVGYDNDPDQVARILTETAAAHENVFKIPAPWVVFADFGASSLDFELRCYLRDITGKLGVESDLRFALLKRLREEGVEILFPQRVVELKRPPILVTLSETDDAYSSAYGPLRSKGGRWAGRLFSGRKRTFKPRANDVGHGP